MCKNENNNKYNFLSYCRELMTNYSHYIYIIILITYITQYSYIILQYMNLYYPSGSMVEDILVLVMILENEISIGGDGNLEM